MEKYTGLEVAVIGLSGRFPGAGTVGRYWQNLRDGVDAIRSFTTEDAIREGEAPEVAALPHYVTANAFLDNKQLFDAAFFNYRPDEAALMDPQMRIFHECCWEALEDSGISTDAVVKKKIGLFSTGSANTPWVLYALDQNKQGLVDDFTAMNLRDINFLSARIAYQLNLKGPAVYVQTACSSSLVAIHQAYNSILLGECEIALAGGVNIQNHSRKGYLYQEGLVRSKDGRCRPFDAAANGTVGGEGAGVVVLKKLAAAIRDGDHIYAVIKGSAINNDGSEKAGFTAPGVKGQVDVIKRALMMAKVQPQSVRYVETHGTATELGDPIEIEALNEAYGPGQEKTCAIGSVKSNIGHLDSAAGVAGFIKAVLAIKHRELPPSLHYVSPNPRIDFDSGPFYVNASLNRWPAGTGPLRAGVSSFGIGGTNAHLILEEAPAPTPAQQGRERQLIVLSARSQESLDRMTANLATFLKEHPDTVFPDLAYTLHTGRNRFKYRRHFVCQTTAQVIRQLEQQTPATVARSQEDLLYNVFMFPGQGTQYINMCRELYLQEPFFREQLNECLLLARKYADTDFEAILSGSTGEDINNTRYAQPLLFFISYSLARLLINWGIRPDFMIGHSLGEYVAACISEVMSLEDAIRLVILRGVLMSRVQEGAMLSVELSASQLHDTLGNQLPVDIAAINGPHAIVLSGSIKDINDIQEKLTALQVPHKRLHTSHAFHSAMMDEVLVRFEKELLTVIIHPPKVPYISNLTGTFITAAEVADPTYWSRHLRNTVQFHEGIRQLLEKGHCCFIEAGPGRALSGMVQHIVPESSGHAVINLVRQAKQPLHDQQYLFEKLGQLWAAGIKPDWQAFYAGSARRKLSLPAYPFESVPFTADFRLSDVLSATAAYRPSTGDQGPLYFSDWKKTRVPAGNVPVPETVVLFTGNTAFSASLTAAFTEKGSAVIRVINGNAFRVADQHNYEINPTDSHSIDLLWKQLAERNIHPAYIVYDHTLTDGMEQDYHRSLQQGYLGVTLLAQSIIRSGINGPVKLIVIGNHMVQVNSTDMVEPLKAAVIAPVKIIPSETDRIKTRIIDIPYPFEPAETAFYLGKIMLETGWDNKAYLAAYRHGERYVKYFEPLQPDAQTDAGVVIIPQGTYLITGGFGGMGFAIAADLAERYQARIILVHRRAFPGREAWAAWLAAHPENDTVSGNIRKIMAMEAAGGAVSLYQTDIAAETAVQELAQSLRTAFPVINGLIWAAGEIDHGGIILNRKAADLLQYTRSKIQALLLFERYFDFSRFGFAALFSSIGNVFYQIKYGQVAYNAANEFVDSYAAYLRRNYHLHAFAINWCDWLDVGMTVKALQQETGLSDTALINARVVNGIYPAEGVRLFHQCLQSGVPVITVHKGELNTAIAEHEAQLLKAQQELQGNGAVERPAQEGGTMIDILLELLAAFFGKPSVLPSDDFFELGGDSLKAMTLAGRINQRLGVNITIPDLYKYPTAEAMQALLLQSDNQPYVAIEKAPVMKEYPMSAEQRAMYILQEYDPENTAYNETAIFRVTGHPDKARIAAAFSALLQRHEGLRAKFIMTDNGPRQVIVETVSFSLEELPYTADMEMLVHSFIKPFLLQEAPVFRAGICYGDNNETIVLMDSHHIIMDGPSKSILLQDFNALYQGTALPDLRLQFRDYTMWQHGPAYLDAKNKQREFWLQQFAQLPAVIELPQDFPRPATPDGQGDVVSCCVPAEDYSRLKLIAAMEQTTMFTLVLTVCNVLLSRLSGEEDMVIGTPISNRMHADLEQVVGMFVNTLALRNHAGGEQSFRNFLRQVKANTLQCLENRNLPFEELVDELKIERTPGHNPLFDILYVFQSTVGQQEQSGISVQPAHRKAKFDLVFSVVENDRELELQIVYATCLFRRETISQFAVAFLEIIREVLTDPDILLQRISLMPAAARRLLLDSCRGETVPVQEDVTVATLFHQQIKANPDRIALIFHDTRLSYAELDRKITQVAAGIISHTNGAHVPVGLLFEPSPDMICAIWGIIRAGGIYVPLSPAAGIARNSYILNDCGAGVILTQSKLFHQEEHTPLFADRQVLLADALPEYPVLPAFPVRAAEDIIYIVYTSGTTGHPKGVKVRHRGLVNYAQWYIRFHELSAGDVGLQLVPYNFDGFGADLYPALCSGGALVIVPEDQRLNSGYIVTDIVQHEVSYFAMPPGLFKALLEEAAMSGAHRLRFVTLAGDKAGAQLVARTREVLPAVSLHNEYGPTETTIGATHSVALSETTLTVIGQPLYNVAVYVLDKYLELCLPGVKGELYIGGTGVAAGYVNNAELTASKFLPDPFVAGTMMYRTGDTGRMLSDGNFEFIGRTDDQMKLRGFRIEPGEIMHHVNRYEGVRESVVVLQEEQGDKYLVCYYSGVAVVDEAELRAGLQAVLPAYMVPQYFVWMSSLPLSFNGKVDRKQLPPVSVRRSRGGAVASNAAEQLLCNIWVQVLGMEEVSIDDHFFTAGGDSIKSIQLSARLRQAGFELSVKELFRYPTVREQAVHMRPLRHVADQSPVTGEVIPGPVQRWLLRQGGQELHHFNQSVLLEFPAGISEAWVRLIFGRLQEHHDALRLVLRQQGTDYRLYNEGTAMALSLETVTGAEEMEAVAQRVQRSIDLSHGPLMKVVLFQGDVNSRVLIVIHHLAIDGVSWRILFEDIDQLYRQLQQGAALQLPQKTDAYQRWANSLENYINSARYKAAAAYWSALPTGRGEVLRRDFPAGSHLMSDSRTVSWEMSEAATRQLLGSAHEAFGTNVPDLLLSALSGSIQSYMGLEEVLIALEGHGREELDETPDISRTVGWFTSIYPVLLQYQGNNPGTQIKWTKEKLRQLPNNGVDYLLWENAQERPVHRPAITFNYLGQFDSDTADTVFNIATGPTGDDVSPEGEMRYEWELSGIVTGGQLRIALRYSAAQYHTATVTGLLETFGKQLHEITAYCSNYGKKELTPSDLTCKTLSMEQVTALQEQYDVEDVYHLSPMQEGLLYHALLTPDTDSYFLQMSHDFTGPLDTDAAAKAVAALTARHGILRTVFLTQGYDRPVQVVLKERKPLFVYQDIRQACITTGKDKVIAACRRKDMDHRFDLVKDELVRLTILQTGQETFTFIWSYHHIVMDGWCIAILVEEFRELYDAFRLNSKITLPEVRPYADYISWLEKQDKPAALQYWDKYLSGYTTIAKLKQLEPATSVNGYEQQHSSFIFSAAETARLQVAAARYGVTVNTLCKTAWALLLGAYNHTTDVVFGTVVSGRTEALKGIERMVGLFINTIPERISFSTDEPLNGLMEKIQLAAVESERHAYVPLADIQHLSATGTMLIDHILLFENYPSGESQPGNAAYVIDNVSAAEQTTYNLMVMIVPGDRLEIKFQYNGHVYGMEEMDAAAGYFRRILTDIMEEKLTGVKDFSLLSAETHQLVHHRFNNTACPYPADKGIVDMLDEQADRTPGQTAVIMDDLQLTYRELREWSKKIAYYLTTVCKVTAGDRVGIMLERENWLIPCNFGILRAGAAYVPIDPLQPENRKNMILEDAALKVVITRGRYTIPETLHDQQWIDLDTLSDDILQCPADTHFPSTGGNAPAYVIYTSGSTGRPKGVMVAHHSVINRLLWMQQRYPLQASDIILHKTPIVFDVSVWELFWWAFTGAAVYLLPPGDEKMPLQMVARIRQYGVTTMHFVPSMLSVFLTMLDETAAGHRMPSLRFVFCSGEALHPEHVNTFARKVHPVAGTQLINLYGPTEATVDVSYYDCPMDGNCNVVPIGKPIDNTALYIIGRNGQVLPPGFPGELCIAGAGLAQGYFNNPGLTAEKFIAHPPGLPGRIYRSGDLCSWLPDGNIVYLGRIDEQIKVRGVRIEPGEIENALFRAWEHITDCVAVLREVNGEKCLVAYIAASPAPDISTLRTALGQYLPDYMVPAYIVSVPAIPLTPNGKADKKALPLPAIAASIYKAPNGPTEEQLAVIWSAVLGVDAAQISSAHDFFETGGHSLKAVMLINQIFKHFDVDISLKTLFSVNTIAQQAEYIDNEQWARKTTDPQNIAGEEFIID